jgi:hypothetical protein
MDCIDLASNSDKPDTLEMFRIKFEKVYLNYEKEEKIKRDKKLYIIIDGLNLAYVLADSDFSKKFFKIGLLADSVICCRVSPKQKSLVVKLVKDNTDWITLSIGDGANDVPMIMEAHIGVGIAGKEGSQVININIIIYNKYKLYLKFSFIFNFNLMKIIIDYLLFIYN